MTALKDAPIFVIGTPRSGTTLTAQILGRHSRIFMPGETHFFPDIYAKRDGDEHLLGGPAQQHVFEQLGTLYQRYNEPADQQRVDSLLSDSKTTGILKNNLGDYRAAFSCFMEIQMKLEGKSRWGNNTPKDIFFVEDIVKFYPKAKFVICVRDVRDFLCSYQGKWQVTAEEQVERLKRLYHPVVTSVLWKSSMRKIPVIETLVPSQNRMILPYEQLVENPEKTIKKLCIMVEEEFEPDMLGVTFSNSSERKSGGGIYATSTGKWRHQLSKEELWIAQRVAAVEMRQLGYNVEKVSANPLRLIMSIGGTPIALWRALQANKKNSGPILPYLIRRISALFFQG